MKERLLVIVGPTAVGKTDISIELAKRFNGEIISGDSMQIYRGLDIGTAKISKEEMQGIPHHMIDIKDPEEPFSVSEYQELARHLISEVNGRGRLPMLVGGTGLYVHAITYDYRFTQHGSNSEFRKRMDDFAEQYGNKALHEKLKTIDPESYKKIHPNNRRRVIRALEVMQTTGKPLSAFHLQENQESIYDALFIGLTMDRQMLYERINHRVDMMIKEGLIEEAYHIYNKGIRKAQSVQAIGYKELFQYFDGELAKHEAVELLKQNSRRYAKRQLTWFKNKMEIHWFDMTNDLNKKKQQIIEYVAGKFSRVENNSNKGM